MQRELLIESIRKAFHGVKLEEGIGLWEAQGLDDYLPAAQCKKLREVDEREDWRKIPVINLYKCSSSLSFFDAKGFRFHLPIFLLFALDVFEEEEDRLFEEGLVEAYAAPEVEFHLTNVVDYTKATSHEEKMMYAYHEERFSLLNKPQVTCVIDFLQYRLTEIATYSSTYHTKNFDASPATVNSNRYYSRLKKALAYWTAKRL
ncbi:MAG: DUF6714 family protein [Thermonemataceae bacterium]